MRFIEVEHKFVVPPGFDLDQFARALARLGEPRLTAIRVRDRYYLTGPGQRDRYVIRHRFDDELQQLTIKSLTDDTAVRDEINLDLGHHAGDQADAVEAFVGRMGVTWSGEIRKDLRVWAYPDCEVVHYVATAGDHRVACVEFEAINAASVADALAVVDRYERATGFDASTRDTRPLFQLLFPDATRT